MWICMKSCMKHQMKIFGWRWLSNMVAKFDDAWIGKGLKSQNFKVYTWNFVNILSVMQALFISCLGAFRCHYVFQNGLLNYLISQRRKIFCRIDNHILILSLLLWIKKDSLAFYTSTCMGIKMKAIQNKGQNPNGSWKMLLESAFP